MKVAINVCFGGFGLSNRALKAYCNRKGIPCHFYRRPNVGLHGPYTPISDDEAFADNGLLSVFAYRCETAEEIPSQENWQSMSMEERKASNAAYEKIAVPYYHDIERDDADLITVIEELGRAANGICAELRIVEIPDGAAWKIEEYDGNEHVAEEHRTWR